MNPCDIENISSWMGDILRADYALLCIIWNCLCVCDFFFNTSNVSVFLPNSDELIKKFPYPILFFGSFEVHAQLRFWNCVIENYSQISHFDKHQEVCICFCEIGSTVNFTLYAKIASSLALNHLLGRVERIILCQQRECVSFRT